MSKDCFDNTNQVNINDVTLWTRLFSIRDLGQGFSLGPSLICFTEVQYTIYMHSLPNLIERMISQNRALISYVVVNHKGHSLSVISL